MIIRLLFFIALLICLAGQASEQEIIYFAPKPTPLSLLKSHAKIVHPEIRESSGLLRCSWNENYLWTVNDSGKEAFLFLIDLDGNTPSGWENGVRIQKVKNKDWESLARSPDGKIVIGDLGNNKNNRKDLQLIFLDEPTKPSSPITPHRVQSLFYPEQKAFPPKEKNFDCEALFTIKDDLYLFTKNRSNSYTSLYKVPRHGEELIKMNTLSLKGQVTGSDISPNGNHIAVLTYNRIWIFENSQDTAFWQNPVRSKIIFAFQCEAVSFISEQEIIISNEQRNLYKLSLEDIPLLSTLKAKDKTIHRRK